MMMEFAATVGLILIILLLAFLGDRTAFGLQRLARDWKEFKEKADRGRIDSDASRKTPAKK